jgi:hypothetical protein
MMINTQTFGTQYEVNPYTGFTYSAQPAGNWMRGDVDRGWGIAMRPPFPTPMREPGSSPSLNPEQG